MEPPKPVAASLVLQLLQFFVVLVAAVAIWSAILAIAVSLPFTW